MTDPAWEEYLAAARRLDALRRGAATAEDEPGRAAAATLEELTRVRARLAAQQCRLRALGVPEEELHPSPAELAAIRGPHGAGAPHSTRAMSSASTRAMSSVSTRAMPSVSTRAGAPRPLGGPGRPDGSATADLPDGPGTIWATLRRSRTLAESVDTLLAPPRGWAALIHWVTPARWSRKILRSGE